MAVATIPSVMDLQAIRDAAFRNLGQAKADADMAEQRAKQNYSEQLAQSGTNRGKSVYRSRENDSGRGLLHSGIALNDQADVNLGYDQANAGYLGSYENTISQIAAKRLAAENEYQDAQINFDRQTTANYGVDPSDPYNWKKIDADQKAAGTGPYAVDPEDPLGWKKIDADQRAAQTGPYAPKPIVVKSSQVPKIPTVPVRRPAPVSVHPANRGIQL